MAGGLARRAHTVESIRKSEPAVLLLDSGAVFSNNSHAAELSLKAMALMAYDALNLAVLEFNFGREFLEQARSRLPFPFIASNLLDESTRPSWALDYLVKETGGVRVAVLGVLDPEEFRQHRRPEQVKGLKAAPPQEILNMLLPEVRQRADLVVLLSGFGMRETAALVKAVKGIDVAIASGPNDPRPMPESTILLHSGYLGRSLGILQLALDENLKLRVISNRHLHLGPDIPENVEISSLVKASKEAEKLQEDQQHRELMEGLKMTPQEFMERYEREQMVISKEKNKEKKGE